jgi:hypothetical protein
MDLVCELAWQHFSPFEKLLFADRDFLTDASDGYDLHFGQGENPVPGFAKLVPVAGVHILKHICAPL